MDNAAGLGAGRGVGVNLTLLIAAGCDLAEAAAYESAFARIEFLGPFDFAAGYMLSQVGGEVKSFQR